MKFTVVIPARYDSSRFPGKPLKKILNVPMLLRTYRQCAKIFDNSQIIVASDSTKIINFCKKNQINAISTSSKCLTGTDRVAEVANKIDADVYINVQGDEPIFNPSDLKLLADEASRMKDEVLIGFTEITSKNSFFSSSTPKVIMDGSNNIIYMSRSPIPGNKENRFIFGYRQVCAYAFKKGELQRFALQNKKMPLEESEDIESLRFIEMGIKVRGIPMSNQSIPVDHPEDILKVEDWLRNND